MEQLPDIRNVLTPLSLGINNGSYASRALWKQPRVRFTSTPRQPGDSLMRPTSHLDSSYLNELIAESPILPARSKVNLVFGRKQSIESDRLSISTGVLATMGRMELCDNNNDSGLENLQKGTIDRVKKNDQGENSSSIDAQEKFKKQLNKNKKSKGYAASTTPKKKSPKVYKIGLKRIIPEVATKKLSGSNKLTSSAARAKRYNDYAFFFIRSYEKSKPILTMAKSPKNKSPRTYKICPTKKVVGSNTAVRKVNDPSKDEHITGSSGNYSGNKSPRHGPKHSELKMSRCAKSPRLRTAERALVKQHRDEIRKEKDKVLEVFKQKELEELRRREEQELLKMRQQTLFKANPIRKYVPLPNVKKRALTDPISPNLSKKRRIESSSQTSSHSGHSKT